MKILTIIAMVCSFCFADHKNFNVTTDQLKELQSLSELVQEKAQSVKEDFDQEKVFVSERDRKYFRLGMEELERLITGEKGIPHWIQHVKENDSIEPIFPDPKYLNYFVKQIWIVALGETEQEADSNFKLECKNWENMFKRIVGDKFVELTCGDAEKSDLETAVKRYIRSSEGTLTVRYQKGLRVSERVDESAGVTAKSSVWDDYGKAYHLWKRECWLWLEKAVNLGAEHFLAATCGLAEDVVPNEHVILFSSKEPKIITVQ